MSVIIFPLHGYKQSLLGTGFLTSIFRLTYDSVSPAFHGVILRMCNDAHGKQGLQKHMRKILLATAAMFSLAFAIPAAYAGNVSVQGAAIGGLFNTSNNSQSGSANQISGSFNGSGTGVGSSASGFTNTMNGANGGSVGFQSNGQASSMVSTTPFGVTTSSQHSGFASGTTMGNGNFSATTETFGQSNGTSAFDVHLTGSHSDFNNNQTTNSAELGFIAFEGGAKGFGSFN